MFERPSPRNSDFPAQRVHQQSNHLPNNLLSRSLQQHHSRQHFPPRHFSNCEISTGQYV